MMDGAFDNQKFSSPPPGTVANAKHILVKDEAQAKELQRLIAEEGKEFELLASEYSTCPSGARGGDLGAFRPGTMVPAFDKVIFNEASPIGEVLGPVQTRFGYHLIKIVTRSM